MAIKCPACHSDNPDTQRFCGGCGRQLPPPQGHTPVVTETLQTPVLELTTGSTFAGRYQVIEEIGHGGMGRVYKVFDTDIKEKIALKLLRPEIALERETLERFSNELKLARRISHRNVCRMFDLGKAEGTTFITMEFVPGEDLKKFIRKSGQLGAGRAVSIAKQVCEGLMEAHHLGVVHRDLKPQNIMVDEDGNARIMDFGIARSLRGKGITGAGVMIGTPEYMSPEQVEGKDVDQRSDIYSLGIILYEMLTGRVPFGGDTPFTIGVKHKSEIPRDPREINTQIPQDLGGLVLKCLEKDKAIRYQSARELHTDLEKIEQGLPTTERVAAKRKPFTSREITVKFNLKKLALPLSAVVVLAAMAVLLWILIPHKEAPVGSKIENSIAVISFKNQTGDPAFDYLQEVIPNLLITNLENSGLFYVTTWERMQDVLKQMGVKAAGIVDSGLGFELCRREGIRALAIGTFSRAGEVFIMDVKVLDADTKRTLKSANTRGTGADSIFGSQIDELSREISLGLGAAMDSVEAARLNIKGITTHSLEAYRYFLKGKDGCNLAYWAEARKNLEKALEIDPAFGMAYVYLAWTYVDPGPEDAIVETVEKAMALSDRSSQKDALYLDGLYAYFVEKDAGKAVQRLDELIRRFPDEKWAFHMSGDFVRKEGDLEGAYGRYKKWLDLDPQDTYALYHLSRVSVMMGNIEKAEEYIRRHEAIAPPERGNLNLQAAIYRDLGRIDTALAKYEKAHEVNPDSVSPLSQLTYLCSLKEDYEKALKWANEAVSLAKSPAARSRAYLERCDVLFLKGTLGEAMADCDRAVDAVQTENSIDRTWAFEEKGFVHLARGEYEAGRRSFDNMRRSLAEYSEAESLTGRLDWAFDMGMLAVRQGQVGQAEARLSEIQALLPEVVKELQSDYHLRRDLLQGELRLVQGESDEALTYAKRACGPDSPYWKRGGMLYIPQAYYMDLEARIYALKGDIGRAIAEYERLLGTNYSTGFVFPVHPLYHYRLAILYERANEALKARSRFERFLDLWKDADPGLPEVDDAKKRLAGLEGH